VENPGGISEEEGDEATEESLSDIEIGATSKPAPSELAIGEDGERSQFSFRLGASKDDPVPTQELEDSTDCLEQTESELNAPKDELPLPIRASPQKLSKHPILETGADENTQSVKASKVVTIEVKAVAPESPMEEVPAPHVHIDEVSELLEDSGVSIVEGIEHAVTVFDPREFQCVSNSQTADPLVEPVEAANERTADSPGIVSKRAELLTEMDDDSTVAEASTLEAPESRDFGSPMVEISNTETLMPASSTKAIVDAERLSSVMVEDNQNLMLISPSKEAPTPANPVPVIQEDAQAPTPASCTEDPAETENMSSAIDEDTEISPQLEEEAEAIAADVSEGNVQQHSEAEVEEAETIAPSPSRDQFDAEIEKEVDDIADGLVLGSSFSSSIDQTTSGKLRSPSPSQTETGPDDALHLDDDTAILKDFLTRAAASKASKANIARRTSLQNRRDSGAIRHALASPRKILEDKDPNSPSPRKTDDNTATLDLSQTLTLNMDDAPELSPTLELAGLDGAADAPASPSRGSRRSARTRKTRIPHPPSGSQAAQTPKNISIRRVDGSEPVALRKTEAQELGLLTRTNTRKNKQGAVNVPLRLLKLSAEMAGVAADSAVDSTTTPSENGKKTIRWDEKLVYYQEPPETASNSWDPQPDTEDELSAPITTTPSKPKAQTKSKSSQKDKENEKEKSTPRIRRLRGLGAANGTPGKGLLGPASLLPAEVQEERDEQKQQQKRIPKPSRVKKLPVPASTTDSTPTLDLAPTGIAIPATTPAPAAAKDSKPPTKERERKSRLATPRKLKLPQPASTTTTTPTTLPVAPDGKENHGPRAPPLKGLPVPTPVVLIPVAAPAAAEGARLPVPRRGRPKRG
jgi:hypothetical protein